ncbi:major paralogous domain-containing protein, partial [Williamwhitmania taraxaci]
MIMKKIELAIALALLLLVASCKKEIELNRLPSVPVLLEPQNGMIAGSGNVILKWQASQDAEGDDIQYVVSISNDSISWTTVEVGEATLFRVLASSSYETFSLKKGGKYYWKVKAENSFFPEKPEQEVGESVSSTFYFYTTPPGVSALRDSSGSEFVNLYWTDPDNLDHVEITFEPKVASISQPIKVNAGAAKIEMKGFENGIVYNFSVKAYDKLGHISDANTIRSMPLALTLVHDADFNIYSTVKIGTQTWVRENLRTTKWQDGTDMKYADGDLMYQTGSKSDIYGLYYSSHAAAGGLAGNKNPSPYGYHIPTDEEWKTLERYLGMSEEDINKYGHDNGRGSEAIGNSLKSKTGWS